MFFQRKEPAWFQEPIDLEAMKRLAKILVIDDEKDAFPLEIMRNHGYNIVYWEKVRSLAEIERGEFDIIILDIRGVAQELSEDDGLAVLEHIKKSNPNQVVVAFSGHQYDLSKNRFWKMADDSLSKPLNVITCKDKIDDLLRSKYSIEYAWESILKLLEPENLSDKDINLIRKKLIKFVEKDCIGKFNAFMNNITPTCQNIVLISVLAQKIHAIVKDIGL